MNKRLTIYHRVSLFFFLFSIGLYIINDAFLKCKVHVEVVGYLLFLSLGIYIGFHVCLDEMKRLTKKND